MTNQIYWTSNLAPTKRHAFLHFAQLMANRLLVGVHRYDKGRPVKAALYLTRLKAELKEYERTGNQEHLVNAANYCFLETVAPEHKRAHFKHETRSVTRDGLGMKFTAEGYVDKQRKGD